MGCACIAGQSATHLMEIKKKKPRIHLFLEIQSRPFLSNEIAAFEHSSSPFLPATLLAFQSQMNLGIRKDTTAAFDASVQGISPIKLVKMP